MKNFILAIAMLTCGFAFGGDLPDPSITPGANDPEVVRDIPLSVICSKGFTSGYFDAAGEWHHGDKSVPLPAGAIPVRNVTQSQKNATYREYGMTGNDRSVCKDGYEIDHLCSLELGCNNVAKNRWPQLYCGTWNAKRKDNLENVLHDKVCSGEVSLKDAQKEISTNWIEAYKKYVGDK